MTFTRKGRANKHATPDLKHHQVRPLDGTTKQACHREKVPSFFIGTDAAI